MLQQQQMQFLSSVSLVNPEGKNIPTEAVSQELWGQLKTIKGKGILTTITKSRNNKLQNYRSDIGNIW
jgi:hypothetical protein